MTKKITWITNVEARVNAWANSEDLRTEIKNSIVGLNSLQQEYIVWPKAGGAETRIRMIAARLTSTYATATIYKDSKEYSI